MKIGSKKIIIAQLVIIIILAWLAVFFYSKQTLASDLPKVNLYPLISERISSGVLQPKSYLITNYDQLENFLQDKVIENNSNVSIYVENLRNGVSFGIRARNSYVPASLNKIPLAIVIMKEVEDGKLKMETMLDVLDSDRSNASGTLYKTPEKKFTAKLLVEKMLQESDNTAFNVLRRNASLQDMEKIVLYLDYYTHDTPNYFGGNGEQIDAKSMYNVFSSLYLSTLLEPKDSEYILNLLTNTTLDIKKIAQVPENVTIAHKYGSKYITGEDRYFHDCGIIYIGNARVFYCTMTKGLSEEKGLEVAASVVNNVYHYTLDVRRQLSSFMNSTS